MQGEQPADLISSARPSRTCRDLMTGFEVLNQPTATGWCYWYRNKKSLQFDELIGQCGGKMISPALSISSLEPFTHLISSGWEWSTYFHLSIQHSSVCVFVCSLCDVLLCLDFNQHAEHRDCRQYSAEADSFEQRTDVLNRRYRA